MGFFSTEDVELLLSSRWEGAASPLLGTVKPQRLKDTEANSKYWTFLTRSKLLLNHAAVDYSGHWTKI